MRITKKKMTGRDASDLAIVLVATALYLWVGLVAAPRIYDDLNRRLQPESERVIPLI